jgi:putative peptidoglycan lipid II flippase
MKIPRLIKAVGFVTLISGLGKILGFGRETIIASYFGASEVADVFFVSSLVPTILFTAIGTAIQAGIIPLFMEERQKNSKKAVEFMSVLGTFFLLISLLIILVTFIFAKPLVALMAPGFDSEQLNLAVKLTRIMIPSMLFLTLTAISTGVLNANKQFVLPAFTATVQNVIIILATIFLANTYGVTGLSIGVLLGAAGQFLIQYPSFSKSDIHMNIHFQENKEQIKKTLILFYPIIIASMSVQLNSLVDRMVSSGLETGSVSALNYANRLLWLPLSVILTPLITVLYPTIVEAALESYSKFFDIVKKGMTMIIFLGIPFMIVMTVSGKSLVEFVFERGAFNTEATSMTTFALLFYSIGLLFFALRDYLMNCFYAIKKTKFAMYSCLVAVLVNIALSVLLSKVFQIGGVALATSISMLLQCIFLFTYLVRKRERDTQEGHFLKDLGKMSIVIAILFLIALPVQHLLVNMYNLIELVIITIIVFGSYLLLSFIFKVSALNPLLEKVKKKKELSQ